MKRLYVLLVLVFLFSAGCAGKNHMVVMQHYYAMEAKRIELANKILEERAKRAGQDLVTLDLNKDGSVGKIKLANQYIPIDPAVADAINRQVPPPENPASTFWTEFFGMTKTIVPWGLGTWAIVQTMDTIAESAGDHSIRNDNSQNFNGDDNTNIEDSEIDIRTEDNDTTTISEDNDTTTKYKENFDTHTSRYAYPVSCSGCSDCFWGRIYPLRAQ